MKEKLVSLFSGKALYISIASILVCAVAVSGSVIAVKVNNNKLDKALESLSNVITEGTTESTTEATTEMASESLTVTTITPQDVGQVKSEYGDKGIAYLKEYDKLTETYKAKRAELEKQLVLEGFKPITAPEPIPSLGNGRLERNAWETDEHYAERVRQHELNYAAMKKEYDEKVSQFDREKKEYNEKVSSQSKHNENIKKQITNLDAKYQKDVDTLKLKYGIK